MVDVILRDVDPAKLPEIIKLLEPTKPELLEVPQPTWTVDEAEQLFRDLRASALQLLRELVRRGGRVEADVMRGPEGDQSLRGLTGPITKAMTRLERAGRVREGLEHPVRAEYDPEIRSYQRALAFTMPDELLPTFTIALQQIEEG
ncbi:hypothetical protein [Actinocatenispora rupis]|uniref:Uncharacterized protein n=1 Tax=Actinocatenispora rupis TaxID=519421 RepID=A0A8J3JIW4_9ACTN|nr:hypothetical protein [Actinocatenispora rupis]GID15798.1 hypothetical protein Aru02nite_66870 [Actinocatenispora rupis]